jgi:transcriptional regulator with XRE-family HTH domain
MTTKEKSRKMTRPQDVPIGRYISLRSKELGIGAQDIAEAVGISLASVYRYQQGLAVPTLGVLQKIAGVLKVSIGDLASCQVPFDEDGRANKARRAKRSAESA